MRERADFSPTVQVAVGAAGAIGLTAAAVAQFWLHHGWVIYLWIGAGALSLWLLARGLNLRRQALGTRVIAAVLAVGVASAAASCALLDAVTAFFEGLTCTGSAARFVMPGLGVNEPNESKPGGSMSCVNRPGVARSESEVATDSASSVVAMLRSVSSEGL